MIGNFFIQPFDIFYKKYSGYIYAQIKGHRVYKEIYIVSDKHPDGKTVIIVAVVCHNGRVYKYVNDEETIKEINRYNPCSGIYYSPIKILKNENKGTVYINIFFRTEKSDKIEIEVYCPKKLHRKKHAITKKESNYSNGSSRCTIFYSGKIMYASNKSCIRVMGKEYGIKKKKIFPLIAKNLNMYSIKDLGVINIFTIKETIKIKYLPETIKEGEKFVYTLGERDFVYNIEKIVDDNIYISIGDTKIVAKKTDEGPALFKIFITMHTEAPEIAFYMPINFITERNIAMSTHRFSLTMGKSFVEGDAVYYGKGNEGFDIAFISSELGWKKEHPLMTKVRFNGDGTIDYESGIMYNENIVLNGGDLSVSN